MNSQIFVDFDGTLAHYDHWSEDLGAPIMPMLDRVQRWLRQGYDVRICTARVDDTLLHIHRYAMVTDEERERFQADFHQRAKLRIWCIEHIGRELPVTNCKSYQMIVLYDDRAVGVEKNTGKLLSAEYQLR